MMNYLDQVVGACRSWTSLNLQTTSPFLHQRFEVFNKLTGCHSNHRPPHSLLSDCQVGSVPHLIVNWKGDQALIDFHAILYTVENTSFPSQEKSSRLDHLTQINALLAKWSSVSFPWSFYFYFFFFLVTLSAPLTSWINFLEIRCNLESTYSPLSSNKLHIDSAQNDRWAILFQEWVCFGNLFPQELLF